MGDGLSHSSLLKKGGTEVVVGPREAGLDFQGLSVMGHGLVDLSATEQGPAEVVVGQVVVGAQVIINSQSFTKTSNCWGVDNNKRGTNSNRIVVFRK